MPGSRIVGRVKGHSLGSASIIDLLAVGVARREEDVDASEQATLELVRRLQSVQAVATISAKDLTDAYGLDGFEILRAQALIELGRRAGMAGKGTVTEISRPEDVFELLKHLQLEKREHFVALLLDSKNQLLRAETIHIGTLTTSLVGPREVFRSAVREGASSLIVAHNHPSGDPTPSPEDLGVTDRLKEVGQLLDIPLLDHVVIGDNRFVSLSQIGVL